MEVFTIIVKERSIKVVSGRCDNAPLRWQHPYGVNIHLARYDGRTQPWDGVCYHAMAICGECGVPAKLLHDVVAERVQKRSRKAPKHIQESRAHMERLWGDE